MATTIWTKYAAMTSASRWIGARVRCASPTMCTMRASSVSAPTRSARITSEPLPLTVAPVTLSPAALATGTGSPVIMDSSTRLAPSSTVPSTGHLLARLHAQPVADRHALERHLFLGAVVAQAPGEVGRELAAIAGSPGWSGPSRAAAGRRRAITSVTITAAASK